MDTDIQIDYRGFIKSKITGNSHTLDTALSELIHNSISAKASDIFILHNYCSLYILLNILIIIIMPIYEFFDTQINICFWCKVNYLF